ncbi:4-alpha-glucanotransferase [Parahaliea maris]|uniref:4-alpha-glucanotransferase n=1 Tax=Parahaliea maris TaxID=2716870 RepID=A0A5C9A947_9GAMM|nr:4-alpha-glucanotransferase [Parahaliea maris]TXS96584.1 4-alpha-glucanotransferase [Parahaliea maris]
MDDLGKLLYLAGVSADYLDYHGVRREISHEDRLRALRAMGVNTEDTAAVSAAVNALDADPWRLPLRPWYILSADAATVILHSHPDNLQQPLAWRLELEDGSVRQGSCRAADLSAAGEYFLDGLRYTGHQLELGDVPPGYHRLVLDSGETQHTSALFACPARAHEIDGEERFWGVSCQLYTLRSERNWGVGDFTDLRQLVQRLAELGADLVGLNPLHAPCSDSPDAASPYSPSDRRFLNPVYLDPEQIADWQECEQAGTVLLDGTRMARRNRLHDAALVDYDRVNALKYELFEVLYANFRQRHLGSDSLRARQFADFVAEEGEGLQHFSRYEMAHNPFPRRFGNDPRFFQYLQWQALAQLAQCQQAAEAAGMRVGLMRDLAVGAVSRGSEVRQTRGLFLPEATVGAPPDPLGPLGQDWGLPVINPLQLRQQQFAHFIELLRRNMDGAGALRIDHAMALMRLWWCLPESDDGPRSGLYVYYPRDELMALLRLESWRHRCLVVGEDLGVVPDDFRAEMHRGHIYGNRLLYFDTHLDGRHRLPDEQAPDTLTMITNHDVPTLADWWAGSDLERREVLGLYHHPGELAQQLDERRGQKQRLLDWLVQSGSLPPGQDPDQPFDLALCRLIHTTCARGRSRLLLLQLEDLQLMREPVNIPGTYLEYPNWRRKQGVDTARLLADPAVLALLADVDRERKA